MREKLESTAFGKTYSGITPAYAGKTRQTLLRYGCIEDHPRVCGKNIKVDSIRLAQKRITPAYAGKTAELLFSPATLKDHPRVCGKNCPSFDYILT